MSEREYVERAQAITGRPLAVAPRLDRIAWIDRQEDAALRLARAKLAQAHDAARMKPFQPGDARIGVDEASTLVVTAVRRRFCLMRLEAMR